MSSLLITNIRIFDGSTIISSNGSVLISNKTITKVSTVPITSFSGPTISKPNHTLLPGLIDAHVHIDPGNDEGLAQGLRFGVTTQCDLGNVPSQIHKLREEMVGAGDCSDLKAATKPATPEGGWPAPLLERIGIKLPPEEKPLETAEQGRQYVRDQIQDGADYIKIIHESGTSMGKKLPTHSSVVEKAIVEEAHSAGRIVLAHALSHSDALHVLSLGVDGTAHGIVDSLPTDELIQAYKKHNTFCSPALTVSGSATSDGLDIQKRYASDPRVQGMLAEGGRERMCQCLAMTEAHNGSLRNAVENVKALKEAGIDIVCGTDASSLSTGTAYGLSLHQELGMFVENCGFTPIEALRSTTSVTARRFGFSDRGWIREGMRADLVLVEGDPTTDIDRTLDLRGVWVAGELCSYYQGNI